MRRAPPKLSWRPLTNADLRKVEHIASLVHPEAAERPEVFEEKLRLFPEGCFALENERAMVGYSFSHPWMSGDVPPLDSLIGNLPVAPNCLHLHDVGVLAEARGGASARALMSLLTHLPACRELSAITLVALYGTERLWNRFGFANVSNGVSLDLLRTYGPAAVYMKKSL